MDDFEKVLVGPRGCEWSTLGRSWDGERQQQIVHGPWPQWTPGLQNVKVEIERRALIFLRWLLCA
jgi:hypothetical protein